MTDTECTEPHPERVQHFLPTNTLGMSAKDDWADNHAEFIAETEDNPRYLLVYSDGSLTKRQGRRLTGFGVVGYSSGQEVFRKGKPQSHSREFRRIVGKLLNESEDTQISISWCPGHRDVRGNKEADELAKLSSHQRPQNPNFKSQAYIHALYKREMLEAWVFR